MIEIYILLCCSSELRVGPGVALFNFLADCVEDFVKKLGMENVEFSLGLHLNFDFTLTVLSMVAIILGYIIYVEKICQLLILMTLATFTFPTLSNFRLF